MSDVHDKINKLLEKANQLKGGSNDAEYHQCLVQLHEALLLLQLSEFESFEFARSVAFDHRRVKRKPNLLAVSQPHSLAPPIPATPVPTLGFVVSRSRAACAFLSERFANRTL